MLDAYHRQAYTHAMRKQRTIIILMILSLLSAVLAACSPGHLGGNEIAFIRNGQLWTIDPDGANAFAIVGNNPPVLGYGWSPNHQILSFRTLDSTFATTAAAKHLTINPIAGLIEDAPGSLNTIGIDGGVPIPIMLSYSDVQFSSAWWNPSGNRLLYRQAYAGDHNPNTMQWWVSQDDQPAGIARKSLPNSFSIPSLSSNNSTAIGNSNAGVFTTAIDGTNLQLLLPHSTRRSSFTCHTRTDIMAARSFQPSFSLCY